MISIDKRVSGTLGQGGGHHHAQGGRASRTQAATFVLAGTAFIDEKTIPSKGRLLVFRVNAKDCKLELVHEVVHQGSIQQLETARENHKYLLMGANNQVLLYSLNLKHGGQFDLRFHDSKICGQFVQVLKVVEDQVIVGDIMNGVMMVDIKEKRHDQVSLTEGPCSSQINIWVNEVIVMSRARILVVDKQSNIFIMERCLEPKNEIEKFKLRTVAQINFGEEVATAILGSFKLSSRSLDQPQGRDLKLGEAAKEQALPQQEDEGGQIQEQPMRKRRKMNDEQIHYLQAKSTLQLEKQAMQTETNLKIVNEQLRTGHDQVRQICNIAIQQLKL
mmetsp:Transcript_19263/g.32822  ORF Transcript_19263/g.32822 Transcript_19263/m.32822 type:complete len:332 (-) Transcript_19263:419-1414(-)